MGTAVCLSGPEEMPKAPELVHFFPVSVQNAYWYSIPVHTSTYWYVHVLPAQMKGCVSRLKLSNPISFLLPSLMQSSWQTLSPHINAQLAGTNGENEGDQLVVCLMEYFSTLLT